MLYFEAMNSAPWKKTCLVFGILTLAVNLFSRFPATVESVYSNGIYPPLGQAFRALTGWVPFSLGDLVYLLAGGWLAWGLVTWIRKLVRGQWRAINGWKSLAIFLGVYLWFNLFWGLNYNRLGISHQLKLELSEPDSLALKSLCGALLDRTNQYASSRDGRRHDPGATRAAAKDAYTRLAGQYPFLAYRPESVKHSAYGVLGNYMGYTGYFNPMTGEAQVNETVPDFLLPFVTCHEIAHQLGYAKEYEANFVGFLAARESADSLMRYSAYLDMFLYANGQLFREDSLAARRNQKALSPVVQRDLAELRAFRIRYRTPVEDWVDRFYTQYLRLNQQPEGMRAYGRVVMWLLAQYRREGKI